MSSRPRNPMPPVPLSAGVCAAIPVPRGPVFLADRNGRSGSRSTLRCIVFWMPSWTTMK